MERNPWCIRKVGDAAAHCHPCLSIILVDRAKAPGDPDRQRHAVSPPEHVEPTQASMRCVGDSAAYPRFVKNPRAEEGRGSGRIGQAWIGLDASPFLGIGQPNRRSSYHDAEPLASRSCLQSLMSVPWVPANG